MIRVTGFQSHVAVIPKTQKMLLDAALLCIQQYKLSIKSKVVLSREQSSAFHYTIEKGAFGSPTLLLILNSGIIEFQNLISMFTAVSLIQV